MNVQVFSDSKSIAGAIPRCMELARRIGADLPFNFPLLSQHWWNHFNNQDASFFWQKRGANFLGHQSSLEKFYLITAEKDGELYGFAPLVAMHVLTADSREKVTMLCYAGDPVLIPYQGITVDPNFAEETVFALLEQLIALFLREDFDILFMGYQLASSKKLPFIRDFFTNKLSAGLQWKEGIISIRGGVYPWTIRQLARRINKVAERASHEKQEIEGGGKLCKNLSNCSPLKLMFPGTRKQLEEELDVFLSRCEAYSSLAEVTEPVKNLLQNRPIVYPYISLPKDHDSFMASLSRSTRYFYRRYMKSFKKNGGSFEVVSGTDITDKDINDYLQLHQARWGRESMFLNKDSFAFHLAMSEDMAAQGLFSLFFALYDNKRIAVLSTFDTTLRRECYFTGMNPEYRKTRGGKLLWLFSIYDAIDRGFSTYDLGPGDFGYKMSLASGQGETKCFLLTKKGCKMDLNSIFAGYECVQII